MGVGTVVVADVYPWLYGLCLVWPVAVWGAVLASQRPWRKTIEPVQAVETVEPAQITPTREAPRLFKPETSNTGFGIFDQIEPYPTDAIDMGIYGILAIHRDESVPLGEMWFVYPTPGQSLEHGQPLAYQKVAVARFDVPQDSAQDVDASGTREGPGHA